MMKDHLKVHPVAALFPMLPDDELKDLAADIKANGLLYPIIVKDKVLIDGRNRLAACKLVGVDPSFEELDGSDPVAYILSSNLARRHMTKGQRAMAGVKAGLLFNSTQSATAHVVGVSRQSVTQAQAVVEYATDLVDGVLSGVLPLVTAYEDARTRKASAESAEARMAELREEATDLADQVVEERLTLAEAIGALRGRRTEIEETKRAVTKNLADAFILLDPGKGDPSAVAHDWGSNLAPELLPTKHEFSVERLDRIIKVLQALRKEVK